MNIQKLMKQAQQMQAMMPPEAAGPGAAPMEAAPAGPSDAELMASMGL